jgi:Ca2+-binding RTX toxin-like protein
MEVIAGSSGNDFLIGTYNADIIDGRASRDYINGAGGDDTLIGGLGNDLLDGGGGNDTFFFGAYHDADNVYNFSRSAGNMDVIYLGDGIDAYLVSQEWNGIRIATVDRDIALANDPVYGAIVLNGVSTAQWVSWGGQLGWVTAESDTAPMIAFASDYPLFA